MNFSRESSESDRVCDELTSKLAMERQARENRGEKRVSDTLVKVEDYVKKMKGDALGQSVY